MTCASSSGIDKFGSGTVSERCAAVAEGEPGTNAPVAASKAAVAAVAALRPSAAFCEGFRFRRAPAHGRAVRRSRSDASDLAQPRRTLQREAAGTLHAPASFGSARAPPCASAVSRKRPSVDSCQQLPFSPPAAHPSLVRNTSPHSELGVSSCMTMLSKSSASRLLFTSCAATLRRWLSRCSMPLRPARAPRGPLARRR